MLVEDRERGTGDEPVVDLPIHECAGFVAAVVDERRAFDSRRVVAEGSVETLDLVVERHFRVGPIE